MAKIMQDGQKGIGFQTISVLFTICGWILLTSVAAQTSEVDVNATSYQEEIRKYSLPKNRKGFIDLISEVPTNNLGDITDKVLLPNGEDIENYVAPFNITNRIVYYFAGYDHEDRPVWIAEVGKWPVRKILEEGHAREFNWHVKQTLHRAFKTVQQRSTADERARGLVCILDFDGLKVEELTYLLSAMFLLTFVEQIIGVVNKFVGDLIILNTSYLAELVMRFLKPVLGGVFERTSIWGTNKAAWLPRLLRIVPKESLPEWYGGSKDYQPVQVYG